MGVGQKCKLIAEQTKYMPGSRTTTSSNSTTTITPIHSRPCVALQIDAKIECVKTLRLSRTKVTASCNSTNIITPIHSTPCVALQIDLQIDRARQQKHSPGGKAGSWERHGSITSCFRDYLSMTCDHDNIVLIDSFAFSSLLWCFFYFYPMSRLWQLLADYFPCTLFKENYPTYPLDPC